MRKLTDTDLNNIVETTINGYHIERVRVKRGKFTDSDHYGILLGRNRLENYVTWQFHLVEDDMVNPYWGHYFMEDRDAAVRDYDNRDLDAQTFKVTITETLKLTVEVEAKDKHGAEQLVSNSWKTGEYVLDADHFVGVEFDAATVEEKDGQTEVNKSEYHE